MGWGWSLIWFLSGSGRKVGWGGRLFEAGRLLTFSAFRMGAYSRWAVIRGWALIRINTVYHSNTKQNCLSVCPSICLSVCPYVQPCHVGRSEMSHLLAWSSSIYTGVSSRCWTGGQVGLTPEAKKLARLDVREPCPLGGSRGIFPQKIWKFYICKDVVS